MKFCTAIVYKDTYKLLLKHCL